MPDCNLKLFRDQVYHCLGNGKDAVFELSDAAILSRNPTRKGGIIPVTSFSTAMA